VRWYTKMDAYWRAANYLSVGQIYLYDNPLLKKPLSAGAHQAAPARSLGHDAGAELHLRSPEPRHQGARSERHLYHRAGPWRDRDWWRMPISKEPTARCTQHISQDEDGMKRLFTQFSFPGGIPSHVAPETPGSIHEGGELGYSLSHAFRRGLRQSRPAGRLRRRRWRSGDRPARHELALEQVPQSGPRRRRAAHSALERLQDRRPHGAGAHSHDELDALFRGYGYTPYFVEGDDPMKMHASWPRRSTRWSARFSASSMKPATSGSRSGPAGR
jgi:xylulose-5-phosphate/fructose-6-phosphate phosphoketolase